MTEQGMILVIGEIAEGGLTPNTKEVLSSAKKLAGECRQPVNLCCLGNQPLTGARQGFSYGADQVYICADPLLEPYTADTYIQALKLVAQQLKPRAVLMAHTDRGMDLAPRLAFSLDSCAVLDCTDILTRNNADELICVKPVFGGKAVSHIVTRNYPVIITIREGAFNPIGIETQHAGEVNVLSLNLNDTQIRVRFLKKEVDENLAMANRLLTADVVVCAGRGVKTEQGLALIMEAAKHLNGGVAATRPVVDSGLLPYSLQVGLTGKKVHPRFYIAAGVSGAVQHMVGCMKSKTIIAINSDETAPIFKQAHLGIIGDIEKVLSAFNKEIETTS